MKIYAVIWFCCAAALQSGCVSNDPDKRFMDAAPIAGKEVTGSHTPVLFPDYFLMDGFELHDHGHIPDTPLVGAGMSTDLDLSSVRTRFSDTLHFHQWETESMEIGKQSFRIIAAHAREMVEIRAVKGSYGPVQIFILYSPKAN